MARMRSLRPDYFLREDMADVSLEAHFLLAGLAVLADRDGRLLDRPRTIKAQVFPFRDVDVEEALGELVSAGVVARYTAGGRSIIALLTWEEDQTPHPKETSLGLPPPPYSSTTAAFHDTPQPSRKVAHGSGNVGDGSGRVRVGLGVGIGCGSRDGSDSSASPLAPADAAPVGEELPDATQDVEPVRELFPTEQSAPKKPRQPRKPPEGPHAELWRALEAEYLRVMGHPYASGNGAADASAVKWLREQAKADIPEAVRRWGNLLRWSKDSRNGYPTVTGFQVLRTHWVAPQVLGTAPARSTGTQGPVSSRGTNFLEDPP